MMYFKQANKKQSFTYIRKTKKEISTGREIKTRSIDMLNDSYYLHSQQPKKTKRTAQITRCFMITMERFWNEQCSVSF